LKQILATPIKALTLGRASKLQFIVDLHILEFKGPNYPRQPWYEASLGTREVDDACINSLYAKGNRLINGVAQTTINEDNIFVYPIYTRARLPVAIVQKDDDCVQVQYINPVYRALT
jgi:hypothetical protein